MCDFLVGLGDEVAILVGMVIVLGVCMLPLLVVALGLIIRRITGRG